MSSQGYVTVLGSFSDGAIPQPMPIEYAGGAPGEVNSVFQINAQLPAFPYGPTGTAIPCTLYLLSAGIASPLVKVYVGP